MKNIVAEIQRLINENDPGALDLIYKFAGRELFSYMAGITGSRHDAEDLLNDLFIKIAEKKESLLKAKNLKAYLYRMAANMAYDRIKKRKQQEQKLGDYAFVLEAKDEVKITGEDAVELNKALNKLPVEQKEVVVMKFFMEKTFEEVSDVINVSINTAVSRYRYALKKLRTILEDRL